MDTDTRNPAQDFERHRIQAFDLDLVADTEANEGRPYVAKWYRKRAAGHRAAATRIARREGWI